jgi:hypothetical protein
MPSAISVYFPGCAYHTLVPKPEQFRNKVPSRRSGSVHNPFVVLNRLIIISHHALSRFLAHIFPGPNAKYNAIHAVSNGRNSAPISVSGR